MERLPDFASGLLGIMLLASPAALTAQEDAGLAQKLTNPVADLITIPIQYNYDQDIGPADRGSKSTLNVQPVIPFRVNEEMNLITRTIVPFISQEDIIPGSSQSGLGDISLSLFFSPRAPTAGGWIWGAGPVFLLPTASKDALGAEKWGAGPAAVLLTMRGPWTLGMLANHLWSFAGENRRADISNTFIQPFAAYTWPSAWTLSVQTETTYNWKTEKSSVPINVSASRLVRLGRLPVSLSASVGYWATAPETGPEGLRWRLQANIVLPR